MSQSFQSLLPIKPEWRISYKIRVINTKPASQVIGTAALMVCVLALGDSHNFPAPPGLEPVLVGGVVMVIGVSMGSNSGYAINPARDLGPRVFTCIAGWGDEVFRSAWHAHTLHHKGSSLHVSSANNNFVLVQITRCKNKQGLCFTTLDYLNVPNQFWNQRELCLKGAIWAL